MCFPVETTLWSFSGVVTEIDSSPFERASLITAFFYKNRTNETRKTERTIKSNLPLTSYLPPYKRHGFLRKNPLPSPPPPPPPPKKKKKKKKQNKTKQNNTKKKQKKKQRQKQKQKKKRKKKHC